MRGKRDYHQRIKVWLEAQGAEGVRLEQGGAHMRFVFFWQGRWRRHPVAGTPSDAYRAVENLKSELRHALGLVTGERRVGTARRKRRAKTRTEAVALPHLHLAKAAKPSFGEVLAAIRDRLLTAEIKAGPHDDQSVLRPVVNLPAVSVSRRLGQESRVPLRTPWLGRRQRWWSE